MDCTFVEYIKDVKSQLYCNATTEYIQYYVVYDYTNNQIDLNLNYFKDCLNSGLSAYKALLFFNDIL